MRARSAISRGRGSFRSATGSQSGRPRSTTSTVGARWLAVMDAATIAAGWKPRVANSIQQTGTVRTGCGFGLGTFANSQVALVVDSETNVKTGKMVAKHVWIAQNNGITVNLEGVGNQLRGALIMGLSRAEYEAPSGD